MKVKKHCISCVFVTLIFMFTCIAAVLPQLAIPVEAVSADYPVPLARISIYDNSRNLNIAGTTDGSPLNTWTTNGEQNENWRFDLIGSDSNGSYYKIVNQGSGRLTARHGISPCVPSRIRSEYLHHTDTNKHKMPYNGYSLKIHLCTLALLFKKVAFSIFILNLKCKCDIISVKQAVKSNSKFSYKGRT